MFSTSYRRKSPSKSHSGRFRLHLEELEPRINPAAAVAGVGAAVGAAVGSSLPEFQGSAKLSADIAKSVVDAAGTSLDVAAESGLVGSIVVGGGIAGLPESLIIGAALIARHGGQFTAAASATQSLISDLEEQPPNYFRAFLDATTASTLFMEGTTAAVASDVVTLSLDLFDITADLAQLLSSNLSSTSKPISPLPPPSSPPSHSGSGVTNFGNYPTGSFTDVENGGHTGGLTAQKVVANGTTLSGQLEITQFEIINPANGSVVGTADGTGVITGTLQSNGSAAGTFSFNIDTSAYQSFGLPADTPVTVSFQGTLDPIQFSGTLTSQGIQFGSFKMTK